MAEIIGLSPALSVYSIVLAKPSLFFFSQQLVVSVYAATDKVIFVVPVCDWCNGVE